MITTIPVLPGITLRCYSDNRFKQGLLSISFLRPMCREEAALNALLPTLLIRGCEAWPDLRAITTRLDDLYGAAIGTMVRRVGDCHATGLCCGFMEDRFALEGDQILSPMVDFMRELLRRPLIRENGFLPEYVESEKRNLISAIESQRNDKRSFANARLYELMCREDSYGIPRLGFTEDVEAITPQSALVHFHTVLEQSPVDLFYVGSADPEEVHRLIAPIFQGLEGPRDPRPTQTALRPLPFQEVTQELKVAQARLCMGFTTPVSMGHPLFAAMQLCSALLGGGMTSKLFRAIREERSLCYDIASMYQGRKGMMVVFAGIDSQTAPQVREQVLCQLDKLCQGEVTEQELQSALQGLLSGLRQTHDAPGSIENYYSTTAISGLGWTPEEYSQALCQVTLPEICQAARTLALNAVYLLKGVEE